jgi:hypothetical protein
MTSTRVADPIRRTDPAAGLPLWRLHLLRAGYALLGIGLAVVQWPQLAAHDGPRPLMEGVVTCMLVAMSLLALVGLRYPVRMLPILLFESVWKLIWLAVVALPLWTGGGMDEATQEVTMACLWVVIILAVIPWRFVVTQYATVRGDRWR